MPPRKKTTAKKKPTKPFEETLWDTANKLGGSVESSDWSGATKMIRQGCPESELGGANQYASLLLHSSFSLHTSPGPISTSTKGESPIRQKLVENDLVKSREVFKKMALITPSQSPVHRASHLTSVLDNNTFFWHPNYEKWRAT